MQRSLALVETIQERLTPRRKLTTGMGTGIKERENPVIIVTEPDGDVSVISKFTAQEYTIQHTIFDILETTNELTVKHDSSAECCSFSSFYEIIGKNRLPILKGLQANHWFRFFPEPVIICNTEFEHPLIEIKAVRIGCCYTFDKADVFAPPNFQVGYVKKSTGRGLLSSYFEVFSVVEGLHFKIEAESTFFSGTSFEVKTSDGAIQIANIHGKGHTYNLATSSRPPVSAFTKVMLLGFIIFHDLILRYQKRIAM